MAGFAMGPGGLPGGWAPIRGQTTGNLAGYQYTDPEYAMQLQMNQYILDQMATQNGNAPAFVDGASRGYMPWMGGSPSQVSNQGAPASSGVSVGGTAGPGFNVIDPATYRANQAAAGQASRGVTGQAIPNTVSAEFGAQAGNTGQYGMDSGIATRQAQRLQGVQQGVSEAQGLTGLEQAILNQKAREALQRTQTEQARQEQLANMFQRF